MSDDIEALKSQLAALEADLQDQRDTAATFQIRNGELETGVLSHLKARMQAERALGAARQALTAKDQEIVLLRSRDRGDPMTSGSAMPLSHTAQFPPPPVAQEHNPGAQP